MSRTTLEPIMSIKEKVIHEVKKTALVTVYFLVGFNLLALLLVLLDAGFRDPQTLFVAAVMAGGQDTHYATRRPGPIKSKSVSVPSDQCIRLENHKCLETAGPDTVEPDPEEALTPSKLDPFALPVVQDRQLLAESEDFEVQNCPATDQDCECCEQRQ